MTKPPAAGWRATFRVIAYFGGAWLLAGVASFLGLGPLLPRTSAAGGFLSLAVCLAGLGFGILLARALALAHGDAGYWLKRGYQNESLLFWHRDLGFLFPSRIASDAGEVPPCFRVGNGPDDFAPDHWAEAVDGSAVFVSDAIIADLREQMGRTPSARPVVVIRGRSHPVVGLTPAHLDEPHVWFDACTGLCPCGELRRQ